MKTLSAVTAAGFSMLALTAHAQALPAGTYQIDATVTSSSSAICPFPVKRPVTGHIYYPGIGKDTTQLVLASMTLGKSVTVAFLNAFPAVPAGGLNGWSAANPVSPNYNQYQNGTLTGGGTAAILAFDLKYTAGQTLPFAQGTVSINVDSIGPCQETLQALFTRTAPFKDAND